MTYATYELINVFCFFYFVYTIYHFHTANIMAQLSSTLSAGNLISEVSDQVKFKPDCSSTSLGSPVQHYINSKNTYHTAKKRNNCAFKRRTHCRDPTVRMSHIFVLMFHWMHIVSLLVL